jgi:UDP-N-acetylmuramoyl-L-alanyl-D-glutamate--2,6-diaminopimelate ligase
MTGPMKLKELLNQIRPLESSVDGEEEVTAITFDSRQAQKGSLFFCLQGNSQDGQRFIPEAVTSGAVAAVVEERPASKKNPFPWIWVKDVREALARAADSYYQHPSGSLRLAGITGTNGKTTITYLIESILTQAGHQVGVIGTVNYRYRGKTYSAPYTTPEAPILQKTLGEMKNAGVDSAIMEVSSHALSLKRVAGCDFDMAVFTNLTPDHLDFHQNLEKYFQAKSLLFSSLGRASRKLAPKRAVINLDDPRGKELIALTSVPYWTYSAQGAADFQAQNIELGTPGLRFLMQTPGGLYAVNSRLIGRHNVSNILAAAAMAWEWGVSPSMILAGIYSLNSVPGRFESIQEGQDFLVVVDYAHTEDALTRTLEAARQIMPAKIITVFGCGGDRDKGKRPRMGRAAAQGSDFCIITSDNPRTEEPLDIIAQTEPGVKEVGKPYQVMPLREEAIAAAINMAQKGDLVLIAGKGHETYQIIGKGILPFDDREIARKYIGKKLK